MIRSRPFSFLLAVLLWGALLAPVRAQEPAAAAGASVAGVLTAPEAVRPAIDLADLDAFVEALREEWHVPGLAVGAIKDGQVVLAKGYGYRNLEDRQPVTERTLMAIGSNSKSFTVVVLGMLEDEERLAWDEPVRRYLPDFQLQDDYAAQKMTVRDLVIHRSGLPRHDLLWYGRSFDRAELFKRLRHLEPTTSFRGRWQYQNLMFMTAGYLSERLTGRTWDDLVHERIFQPLGMARSNTSVRDMPGSDDFSYPYMYRDGKLERVPFRNIDNVAPAGSINSSAEEMLHYVQFHIANGEYDGQRLLSEENTLAMQSPQTLVSGFPNDPEMGISTYGMGLMATTYRGHKLVQHGGGIDGFISAMAWLPEEKIGVVVLSNMSGESNPVPNLVAQRLFDELLGLEPVDWNARTRKAMEEGRQRQEQRRAEQAKERVEGTYPSHALSDYAGTYEHPGYGVLEVRAASAGLEVALDAFTAPLEHFHYDVFEFGENQGQIPLSGRVTFGMDAKGVIDRVMVPLEPSVDPIVFQRKPEGRVAAGQGS